MNTYEYKFATSDNKYDIDRATRAIERYREDISGLDERITELDKTIKFEVGKVDLFNLVESLLADHAERDEKMKLVNILKEFHESSLSLERLGEHRDSLNTRKNEQQARLSEKRQTLLRLQASAREGNFVIDLDTLEQQLRSFAEYEEDTLEVGDEGQIYIELDGVKMRPDVNPYEYINGGGPVAFPMPAIRLELSPRTGHLNAYHGCNEQGETYYNRGANNSPHPHIMSDASACLGDFGPMVQDACQNGNVFEAFLHCYLFLGQANNADSAGMYWRRWVIAAAWDVEGGPDELKVVEGLLDNGTRAANVLVDRYDGRTYAEGREHYNIVIDDNGVMTLEAKIMNQWAYDAAQAAQAAQALEAPEETPEEPAEERADVSPHGAVSETPRITFERITAAMLTDNRGVISRIGAQQHREYHIMDDIPTAIVNTHEES